MVQYIIDMGFDLSDPSFTSARLLEACGFQPHIDDYAERIQVFKLLFRNGAPLRPGATLAAWVGLGGGAELVKEMVRRGVDIDAYQVGISHFRTALQVAAEYCDEEVVVLLLQEGADVNARARGPQGMTALQGICGYWPESPAERAQQMSIINLLLAHGAHVNAAPARKSGYTALQAAAENGNLEAAMLLLSCDTPADVNMPPCQFPEFEAFDEYHNALDMAVRGGRLDMVKLLLNHNALSSYPGDTGYDGAIQTAEERKFLAIADLIREHAATVSVSNERRANLSQPQRDWREYASAYDGYSDGYTTFSDDDEDDEIVAPQDYLPSESGYEDPVAQVQLQYEAVEHPGSGHSAPEPGFVWDVETDNSLDFDNGFGNLADDMDGIYGLDPVPSTSNIDSAAPGWGFGQ